MAQSEQLTHYWNKRDFGRTPEPRGKHGTRDGARYVIQKHEARALHYDLRLEIAGVYVSWAVPKGPSTDPAVKRLAMQTEDHPLEYGPFEGTIPKGEYGGGTVMLWDRGRYRNLRAGKRSHPSDMTESLAQGFIEVWLSGEKLKGGYVLRRTHDGDRPRWLLWKMNDEAADARRNPTTSQTKSVKTGRTMHEIALGKQRNQGGAKVKSKARATAKTKVTTKTKMKMKMKTKTRKKAAR